MSETTGREALARIIDDQDDRWQHSIGAGGYDPDGPPLWLADAVLAHFGAVLSDEGMMHAVMALDGNHKTEVHVSGATRSARWDCRCGAGNLLTDGTYEQALYEAHAHRANVILRMVAERFGIEADR